MKKFTEFVSEAKRKPDPDVKERLDRWEDLSPGQKKMYMQRAFDRIEKTDAAERRRHLKNMKKRRNVSEAKANTAGVSALSIHTGEAERHKLHTASQDFIKKALSGYGADMVRGYG